MSTKKQEQKVGILAGACIVLAIALVYVWFSSSQTADDLRAQNEDITSQRDELLDNMERLEGDIAELSERNETLQGELEAEQGKNRVFEEQISDISKTVGTLDKLARTDPELLQKYSRVYFLNEHYTPAQLTSVPNEHLYYEDRSEEIETRVWPYLEDLLNTARDDGIELYVYSAYRSYSEQASLKAAYTVTYGSGANTFSADQGYSEHQLGTTVDFMTTGIGGSLYDFDTTEAYQWLLDNAHEYGFVLSYPEGNEHYVFEPWHWRFVSTELAEYIHSENLSFYDLNQREIDSYLVTFFD